LDLQNLPKIVVLTHSVLEDTYIEKYWKLLGASFPFWTMLHYRLVILLLVYSLP